MKDLKRSILMKAKTNSCNLKLNAQMLNFNKIFDSVNSLNNIESFLGNKICVENRIKSDKTILLFLKKDNDKNNHYDAKIEIKVSHDSSPDYFSYNVKYDNNFSEFIKKSDYFDEKLTYDEVLVRIEEDVSCWVYIRNNDKDSA